jgi:phosphoribosylglycinamide formyltransferase-1
VACVASNKRDAEALERARTADVETKVFERAGHPDRASRDAALADWLAERDVDLIVLAGYMELLSGEFVNRFRNRIVNVHPALLPSFPGLDAVGQALAHGVRVTGVTVHLVDEGVDSGPIVLQRAIRVPYTRDRAQLEKEIHRVEHELLPEAIRLIAAGAVRVDPENPRVVDVDAEASE